MAKIDKVVSPYPLGAHKESGGVRFAFVSAKEDCGIVLYNKKTGKQQKKIAFLPQERIGNIYSKYIKGIDTKKISYQFYEENKMVADPYARGFLKSVSYGTMQKEENLMAVLPEVDFDWQGDENPRIPYNDCICYCLHVRGFTRHNSSNVTNKGTFAGCVEKIPYLKECGITTVEFQPIYEFLELEQNKEIGNPYIGITEPKLNYWGYKKGFYYAPKASYAASENADAEFKEMVRAFHQNGMEVILQFYFPREIKRSEIVEILRFWVLEYHVDGFHLMGDDLPISMLCEEALLAGKKIWHQQIGTDEKYDCKAALYQDDYLYDMRKFLKGDENMLNKVLWHMRSIPKNMNRIHFLSNYYGMTLIDMVSYDRKHNEDNNEGNCDGNDYNCSWNCGEEGKTRKKKVQKLRIQQLKNAMCMLLFTQSTPLIFMGDEFGNSQMGNNNPYCQDNGITWLDWSDLEKNAEIYEFFKMLVEFRKAHPMLHLEKEARLMDYISCGYPDVSYHSEKAWQPQLVWHQRHIGIMYCGSYVEDEFIYLGMNMHWEEHELALPRLPEGMKWKRICSTVDNEAVSLDADAKVCNLAPRSINIFISERQ